MNEIITLKRGSIPEGDNLISSKLNVMIGLVGGTVPEDGLVTSKLKTILTSLGGNPESMTDGLLSDYLTLIQDLVQDGGLPAGYEELEYVSFDSSKQGTNLPFFEVDFYFNSDTDIIELNVQRKSYGSYFFGTRGFEELGLKSDGYYWKHYLNGILVNDGVFHKCVFNKGFIYDDEVKWVDETQRIAKYPLTIGSIRPERTPDTIATTGSTIYNMGRIRITRNGNFLFDFIPCVNPDGIVGFYDVVNKEFRTSESNAVWKNPAETHDLE